MKKHYKIFLSGGVAIFLITILFFQKENIASFFRGQKNQNAVIGENAGKTNLPAIENISDSIQTGDNSADIISPKKADENDESKVAFEPVTDEMTNDKLDCGSSSEIPGNLRKNNALCQNIYKTDASALADQIKTEKPERLMFYGQHVIYDCPAKNDQVDDLANQCYQSAKFMDDYQYGKMMTLFDVSRPEKRLFVYFADSQAELNKLCNADAVACFDGDNHIFLPLGEKGTHDLYLKAGEESVYGYGTKKRGELYQYSAISPDNCQTPSLLFHEITHYFNHLAIGEMPSWVDESVARIAVDKLVKDICPPGIIYKDVKKTDGSKTDKFDFNADDQVASMISDFWEGNKKKLSYLLDINHGIKEKGLSYFHDLYYAMKGRKDLIKNNTG